MQVLAINGSPRGENSCTDKMLKPLLTGMEEAGAQTEIVHLSKLKMHQCLGCFSCWFKTPGKCVHQDDVAAVLEKFVAADFIIFGTPLYVYNVSGLMKNFLDRVIPIALPFMEKSPDDGVTTHLSRYSMRPKKMLLVSPCGFPEFEHFKLLTSYMQFLATPSRFDCEYVGEILRPTAELMNVPEFAPILQPYFAGLKIAGRQLIVDGTVAKDLQAKLHESWVTPEQFREQANKFFQDQLEALQAKGN